MLESYQMTLKISIHAARVGCDHTVTAAGCRSTAFQSTQPEWAATDGSEKTVTALDLFQSTQPEWAATFNGDKVELVPEKFQSTQPEWAATTLLDGC